MIVGMMEKGKEFKEELKESASPGERNALT